MAEHLLHLIELFNSEKQGAKTANIYEYCGLSNGADTAVEFKSQVYRYRKKLDAVNRYK